MDGGEDPALGFSEVALLPGYRLGSAALAGFIRKLIVFDIPRGPY
ncbi:hypothetical protein [Streptomyces sp. 1222.5]